MKVSNQAILFSV